MLRLALLALIAALTGSLAQAQTPPVRIDSGLLQGVQDSDVVAYKGVPYAAPPVGPLRWRPPHPAPAWRGVRDASIFGPVCPQATGLGVPASLPQSEDCLTLNVWAPAHAAGPAPVMVWLHGGGDDAGTARQPQFDGAVFARDGIVFVSVDYRLGALGWFAHPALTREAGPGAPLGDYGLMDEIAALTWVQRNIRAFGGDPRQVTVAGESAGGEAVLFLMGAPAARGFFARAIVESGTGWADYPTLAKAEDEGVALATRAGAPADADAAALRALPVAALLAANHGEIGEIIDGRLVTADPATIFAAGHAAAVPLLIGSNSGEDSLLGNSDPKDVLKDFTADQLSALRAAYGAETPDDAALGRAVFRDQWMGAPARWIAARQSAHAPAWLYHFAYIPSILVGRRKAASHGFEMLFTFEALARAPIPLPASPADMAEMTLLHGCWASFVKTGVPTCPGGPAWPGYSAVSDTLMLFGQDTASGASHFRAGPYDVLDRIEAERLKKPAPTGEAQLSRGRAELAHRDGRALGLAGRFGGVGR
jgi:para-nitrobenzyl esterase